MNILVREVGCNPDELADNIAFTDLGVDSLMALTVAGKMREELGLEDIESNLFLDYPTIGVFKTYLERFDEGSVPSHVSDVSSDDESPGIDSDSNVTTPPDDSETHSVKGDVASQVESVNKSVDVWDLVVKCIAKQADITVEEVLESRDLPSLGIDSIMSLQICDAIKDDAEVDFPDKFFLNYTTLKDVKKFLGLDGAPKKPPSVNKESKKERKQQFEQQGEKSPSKKIHPRIALEEPAPPKPPRPTEIADQYPERLASSVMLSGSKNAKKLLFMIPDGSGSATSYSEICHIGSGWSVIGLFSPFMKTPQEYLCGVYGMAQKFIAEIRRRQPNGPYSLAGWSAGGVIAYEMVYQLVEAGEEVANLIIIDAPSPVTIEPLPQGLHAWFASIGLLGDGTQKIPEWLLPHFSASITALSNYYAEPIPKDKCPKVLAIWCEDGVCHLPTDPRPEPYPKGHALFLLDNRTDFGPNRWDEYLDPDKMQFRHMPGNHFSMIHGDLAKLLEGFIKEALLR